MAEPARRKMTLDDYLRWESEQEERHELIDGDVILMVGAPARHDVIVMNIADLLINQLRGSPCRVRSSAFKIRTGHNNIRYPDLSVVCAPLSEQALYTTEPRVVFEVLSNSNTPRYMTRKMLDYASIASLERYVIVAQHAPKIESYSRRGGEFVEDEDTLGLDAVIDLPMIGARLPLNEIYRDITFELG